MSIKKTSLRTAASKPAPKISEIVILLVFGGLLFIMGIVCVVASLLPVERPVDLIDIDFAEMEPGTTYDLGEVMVLDSYAEADDRSGNPVSYNLIVLMMDGSGATALGSLEVENTDAPWDQVVDYIGDVDQPIGSLILPVCCSARALSESNELYDWFMEDTSYYQEMDQELSGDPVVLDLAYVSDTADTYMEENSGVDYVTVGLGIVFMVGLGLLSVINGIVLLRRRKRQA